MFIAAHNNFYESLDRFFEFKLIPHLQKTAWSITREFHCKTIGLHIRRTDHPNAPKYSSDESFILKIDALIRNDHNFYLSTDSYSIKTRLKSLYGNKILIHETKSLDRNTKSGIQDAIVDLFCLSRTTKILGSFGSSYSQLAARLNQIPLDIIVNNV